MKLTWSPAARERAADIDAWWREERPAAPHRFTEELIAAVRYILDYPEVPGEVYAYGTVIGTGNAVVGWLPEQVRP